MAELETRRDELVERLGAAGSDHTEMASIGAELESVNGELAEVEERWLELSSELEDR